MTKEIIRLKIRISSYNTNGGMAVKVVELGYDPSVPYQKMYTTLFNALTAALDLMEENKVMMARAVLMEAQQKAEELYIEGRR